MEAESTELLAEIRKEWDDVFEIEVFPVVSAEEGLERLRPMQCESELGRLMPEEG